MLSNKVNSKIDSQLEDYANFLSLTNPGVEYSPLWSKYRKDFSINPKQINRTDERGYGINVEFGDEKIKKFIRINKRKNRLINKFSSLSSIISERLTKIIANSVLGSVDPVRRFWLDHPKDFLEAYCQKYPEDVDAFFNICKKLSWHYSFNSFKSFTYLRFLNNKIESMNLNGKNILEIGGGLCNFAMLLTCNLDSYSYICVDIPEMIPNGLYSFSNFQPDKTIKFFLPHEIAAFYMSKDQKKVLFILPSQLESIKMEFNFFINHESFAEMTIETVNSYLLTVKKKLTRGAIIFIVNRMARCIDREDPLNLNKYTFFHDYDLLGFETIAKQIDPHRSISLGAEFHPNIIYIGQVKDQH